MWTTLLLAVGPPLSVCSPPFQAELPPGPVIEIHYDNLLDPADPDAIEVLAFLRYPPGRGPDYLGYPDAGLASMLQVRGGNENMLVPGQPSTTVMTPLVNGVGAVDINFNFPTVELDEDYRVSADSVALLIQYLREEADALNLDPDAIGVHGRSIGGVLTYSVGLGPDRIDPASPDPVRRRSSRPDFHVARLCPSSLMCFPEEPGTWMAAIDMFFFPGKDFVDTSDAERMGESPVHWLLDPREVGRDRTPPLYVVYASLDAGNCGQVLDTHDGLFGELMLEAMDQFAARTARWDWRARSGGIDKLFTYGGVDVDQATVDWNVERLAEDAGGLWLDVPSGTVGGSATLVCRSVEPGRTVAFHAGTQAGALPLAGCPGVDLALLDGAVVATAVADENGVAAVSAPGAAGPAGSTLRYQAVDAAACEVSNPVVILW